MAIGVLLIGIFAWPMAEPVEPFAVVSAFNGTITAPDYAILFITAFAAGLLGYFISWPYGRQIGPLAVPAGLSIWAVRGGSIGNLMQQTPAPQHRQAIFASLQWEGLFWLAIIAAGLAGVLAAHAIVSMAKKDPKTTEKTKFKADSLINPAIALAVSFMIGRFCVKLLAQDIRLFDAALGSVVAQPSVPQIAFAVVVSFGLAGFVVKKFLGAGFIWPTIASALVTVLGISTYAKADMLAHMAQNHPPIFFSDTILAILPLQMVVFGTLGSITGYWMAVRYDYWRKHESS